MDSSSLAVDISKVEGGERTRKADGVAVEEPLEIQLCSRTAKGAAAKSISITMRTPGDDAELATGFLYTEGIIRDVGDIASIEMSGEPSPDTGQQNIVRVGLKPEVGVDFDRLQRHFYTTSSCGVCGKASLDALRVAGQTSLGPDESHFSPALITALPERLLQEQRVFTQTGGLHAALIFDSYGAAVVVREDVGRHNAVDKVVGALALQDKLPASGCGLLVSGRASFELMQKALVAGIPLLAAVGAPSSLAVQTAQEFDMTLIGFLRDDMFNIYAGEERIT